jgi:hypothetical protein
VSSKKRQKPKIGYDWVDAVIVPMKMASVTTYGFDDYGIDHDSVPDDVDDDVIDGEGELRSDLDSLMAAGSCVVDIAIIAAANESINLRL